MILEKISIWFSWFSSFPLKAVIILLGVFFIPVWVLSLIIGFLIMPIICKFYIVPGIEKKIGKNLGYSTVLSFSPFGRYFNRELEISRYILKIYSNYKRHGSRSLPSGYSRAALKQVGYTIDMVSREELIFSYIVQINLRVMMVSFIIAGLASFLIPH